MLRLHSQDLSHASLAVSDAVLQFREVLPLLALLQALVFHAVTLAGQYIFHVCVLAKGPVCELKLETADQVLCLEVLDFFCHLSRGI